MKRFLTAASAAILAACSSSPENIKASYVSHKTYDSYGCEEILEERRTVVARVRDMSREQAEMATKDVVATVGALIFLPTLLLLAAGTDQEEELAALKGQHEALTEAARRRGCLSEAELDAETRAEMAQEAAVRERLHHPGGDVSAGGEPTHRTGLGGDETVISNQGLSQSGKTRGEEVKLSLSAPRPEPATTPEPEAVAKADPVVATPESAVTTAPEPAEAHVAAQKPAAEGSPPRRPEPEQVIRVRGDGPYRTYETWFDMPEVSDIRVALENWDDERGVVRFTGFADKNGGHMELQCEARARRTNRCKQTLYPQHLVEIIATPPRVEIVHTFWGMYVNARTVVFW